jgi:hypothetical protein
MLVEGHRTCCRTLLLPTPNSPSWAISVCSIAYRPLPLPSSAPIACSSPACRASSSDPSPAPSSSSSLSTVGARQYDQPQGHFCTSQPGPLTNTVCVHLAPSQLPRPRPMLAMGQQSQHGPCASCRPIDAKHHIMCGAGGRASPRHVPANGIGLALPRMSLSLRCLVPPSSSDRSISSSSPSSSARGGLAWVTSCC